MGASKGLILSGFAGIMRNDLVLNAVLLTSCEP